MANDILKTELVHCSINDYSTDFQYLYSSLRENSLYASDLDELVQGLAVFFLVVCSIFLQWRN